MGNVPRPYSSGLNAARVVRNEARQLARDPNVRGIVVRHLKQGQLQHWTPAAISESAEYAIMRLYPMGYSVASVKEAVRLVCIQLENGIQGSIDGTEVVELFKLGKPD